MSSRGDQLGRPYYITFVTELCVTFFLIALQKGDFYLSFIRLDGFFIAILCRIVRMKISAEVTNDQTWN
jgi:hypothetical protein